jgi:hypothetical protein
MPPVEAITGAEFVYGPNTETENARLVRIPGESQERRPFSRSWCDLHVGASGQLVVELQALLDVCVPAWFRGGVLRLTRPDSPNFAMLEGGRSQDVAQLKNNIGIS